MISLVMLFSHRPAFAGDFITITSSGSGNPKRLCMLIVMLPQIDKNLFKKIAFDDCRHLMRVSPDLRDNLHFLQARSYGSRPSQLVVYVPRAAGPVCCLGSFIPQIRLFFFSFPNRNSHVYVESQHQNKGRSQEKPDGITKSGDEGKKSEDEDYTHHPMGVWKHGLFVRMGTLKEVLWNSNHIP
jgi:hypothetical protein